MVPGDTKTTPSMVTKIAAPTFVPAWVATNPWTKTLPDTGHATIYGRMQPVHF